MISKKVLVVSLICLFTVFLLNRCSKLSKEQPSQPIGLGTELHQTGWLDTLSTNFHGQYLRAHNWDLTLCHKCHGSDYAGGTSKSSCTVEGCHTASPEACTTCHGGYDNATGAPPKDIDNHYDKRFKGVGAHTAHLTNSKFSKAFDCSACHNTPQKLTDQGHIDSQLPAEIVWGDFAKTNNLSPSYKDTTCSNVYCHGSSLLGGTLTSPKWNQRDSLVCNSCHGLPPSSGAHDTHVIKHQQECDICHTGYFVDSQTNQATHLDGKKDVQFAATIGGAYANGKCSNVSCHGGGDTPPWEYAGTLGCTTCHGGTDNNSGAPPVDLAGNTSISSRGVGAHTAHVASAQWARAFDCDECHISPTQSSDPGHLDGALPAEIVWGDLAKTDDLSPDWNGSTCADVYCHGNSLQEGTNKNPSWTSAQDLACNACHGLAPNSGAHQKHTRDYSFDCQTCHQGYIINTTVDKQIHIDGKKDVQLSNAVGGSFANETCANVICHGSGETPAWSAKADFTCSSCHGGSDNDSGAPPPDLRGNTSQTATGVGAHTAHLTSAKWSRVFDCTECHTKPEQIADAGHIDGDFEVEIRWGNFSKTGNLTPTWDGTQCSNVYCHGANLSDGKTPKPRWTSTDGISCDACHGLPPKTGAHEEHVEDSQLDCQICHEGYTKNNSVDKQTHLDGKNDVKLSSAVGGSYANGVCSNVYCHGSGNSPSWNGIVTLNCTSCHGGTDNATGAPPVDLSGNNSKSQKGVGAHTVHVSNSKWASAFDCNQCHAKPAQIGAPGHIDLNAPAEVAWGPLPITDLQSPRWNGTTCSNNYCHGSSLTGGQNPNPTCTSGAALSCKACHGLPPDTGQHDEHAEEGRFECDVCHEGYTKDTAVNLALHVNGKKEVQFKSTIGGTYSNGICSKVLCHGTGTPSWSGGTELSCTSCHGGLDNNSGAPPYDLQGNSSTTFKGVGAHSIHVTGGNISRGMDCSECHIKPDEVDADEHIGPELLPAEIRWGNLATTDNAVPQWDGVQTCQNVYCHGQFTFGNQNNAPSWLIVDGTQSACGTCHALPPATPHPALTQCSLCHGSVVDAANHIIDKNKHINGQTDYN